MPSLTYGLTSPPHDSPHHDWTITFDRDAHRQFASATGGKLDPAGVTTVDHEFYHQMKALAGDWAGYGNETAAAQFGESIYQEHRDANQATASQFVELGFIDFSSASSLSTFFDADSFWIEGIEVSFAQGGRFKP
jgi:hypothetical protein